MDQVAMEMLTAYPVFTDMMYQKYPWTPTGSHGDMYPPRAELPSNVSLKPFVCAICGQMFRRKDYLKAHMVIHTGEKRYECCYCKRKFSQKTNMEMHKRRVCQQRPPDQL